MGTNLKIQFALARFDPQGNPHPGYNVVVNDSYFADPGSVREVQLFRGSPFELNRMRIPSRQDLVLLLQELNEVRTQEARGSRDQNPQISAAPDPASAGIGAVAWALGKSAPTLSSRSTALRSFVVLVWV